MANELDEAVFDKRVSQPYHEDGIEDILAAAVFFFCGAYLQPQFKAYVFLISFFPLIAIFMRWFVTFPRVGYIKPLKRPLTVRCGLVIASLGGAALVVLEGMLFYAMHYPASPLVLLWPIVPLHYGLAMAQVAIMGGMWLYTTKLRWAIYALLGLAAALGAPYINWKPVDGVAAVSVLMGICGFVLLIRFIQREQPLNGPDADEGGTGGAA